MTGLSIVDCLLALGACLRLTRFIVADDVPGTWFIKEPLHNAKHAYQHKHAHTVYDPITGYGNATTAGRVVQPEPWWAKYLEGLACPFCVSVWMSAAVTLALLAAGGPGDASDWFRVPAGFLTLAWLTGHIAKRAGDVE